ncbi:MAG: hypothetical protein ACNS60_08010 [Candidatus Cyclobacteriaceae bacterium M2_1C_046]|uniref:Uncharacterized protein n=1 Tax=Marivirga lumbricoides TaxID=1046115 RepID=A0A2T4DGH2_9BACT|nr:hypothetical protein C9994_13505 [Marivirga lumbricoides]
MRLSKNTKKAGLALIGSMAGFLMAKQLKIEDYYPFILLGGFLGNTIGEELIPEECSPQNALGYIDRNGQLKLIAL